MPEEKSVLPNATRRAAALPISPYRAAAIAVVVSTGIAVAAVALAVQMTIWHFQLYILALEKAELPLVMRLAVRTFGSYSGALAFHCVLWSWFVLVAIAWRAHRRHADDTAFIISFLLRYLCWALAVVTALAFLAVVLQSHAIVLLQEVNTPTWVTAILVAGKWITVGLFGATAAMIAWHVARRTLALGKGE